MSVVMGSSPKRYSTDEPLNSNIYSVGGRIEQCDKALGSWISHEFLHRSFCEESEFAVGILPLIPRWDRFYGIPVFS